VLAGGAGADGFDHQVDGGGEVLGVVEDGQGVRDGGGVRVVGGREAPVLDLPGQQVLAAGGRLERAEPGVERGVAEDSSSLSRKCR
jgi:hypothetical protein